VSFVQPSNWTCGPAAQRAAQRPSSRLSVCSRCLPTSPKRAAPAFTPCVGLPVRNRPTSVRSLPMRDHPPPPTRALSASPPPFASTAPPPTSSPPPRHSLPRDPDPVDVAQGPRRRQPGIEMLHQWGIERRTAPHRRSPSPSTGDPSAPLLTAEAEATTMAAVSSSSSSINESVVEEQTKQT
jgi:hypothetical protein